MRDFGLMVKNKLRRARAKVGYLPVQTVDEGAPLETNYTMPQNTATEPMHTRIQLCAQRLPELKPVPLDRFICRLTRLGGVDGIAEVPVENGELKSPLQLLNQVEQMKKQELSQVLERLRIENRELKRHMEKLRSGSTPHLGTGGFRGLSHPLSGRSVPSLRPVLDSVVIEHAVRAIHVVAERRR